MKDTILSGVIANFIWYIISLALGVVIGPFLLKRLSPIWGKLTNKVSLKDENLKEAILCQLDISNGEPITKEIMKTLTELEAHDKGIIDLSGLEYATNLRTLAIGGNEISDLHPVAELTHLEGLYAWDNRNLTDISPLASLTGLRYIDLNGCKVSDITPLMNLEQLTSLKLRGNRILDVSSLRHLVNLEELEIEDNPITGIIRSKIIALKPKREDE